MAQAFREEEIHGEALLSYARNRKELKQDLGLSIGKAETLCKAIRELADGCADDGLAEPSGTPSSSTFFYQGIRGAAPSGRRAPDVLEGVPPESPADMSRTPPSTARSLRLDPRSARSVRLFFKFKKESHAACSLKLLGSRATMKLLCASSQQ